MLVSWEWLTQYVDIDLSPDDMANRFALSGLNHESTTKVGPDFVIDLEVTSNRGDCLGHIGVAREASVLLSTPLRIPAPIVSPASVDAAQTSSLIKLSNRFETGCPRYTGKVIRGVKVAPSPAWMQRRLTAIGVKPVNNIVDATNYVMFECGQPLHAFDLSKIRGSEIVVRPAEAKEKFIAIDHRTYELDPSMVVIADAERAIALGGVMGGEDSEVSESTVDLLIEAADFTPLAIRRAARKLRLHSPASYRFERRVNSEGLLWAAERCCQLIVEMAGGKATSGFVDSAPQNKTQMPEVILRKQRIIDVLGIAIPWKRSLDILSALGCVIASKNDEKATVVAPPFRLDLGREVDLIEEIARMNGYEKIPEDAVVPIFVSARRDKDVMLQRVRSVATAAGYDEALTASVVNKQASSLISPWTALPPLMTQVQLLEGATFLRRSIVPSLIQAYQNNQSQQNRDACLFETALVYLPSADSKGLPTQQNTLAWVGTGSSRDSKGMIEEIVRRVAHGQVLTTEEDYADPCVADNTGVRVLCDGRMLAWYGNVSRSVRSTLKLDQDLTFGELNLDLLQEFLLTIPRLKPIVPYPAIQRDLNFILDESVRWGSLSQVVHNSAGELLTDCIYRETYRDAEKDGEGKKRVLLSLILQSPTQTLTGQQADDVVAKVLKATKESFDAAIVA
ncbi:MAG: phenylalanine--tRNA ligase subunit beta [Planctomycetota bacterium]|nr:phenylalanine--tRNA ligase subunit beta [Planctomycetota bacterium]